MSDYIASLLEIDRPKKHYKLNDSKDIDKLAESFSFKYIQNDKVDRQQGADGKQLIIAPVAKLNQGMGVFATADMPYDDQQPKKLGQYKGKKIDFNKVLDSKKEIDTSYYMDAPEEKNHIKIDGKHNGNWTRFVNHSPNPNIYAEIDENHIWFIQLRDIKAGEQLFIDYGHDYDFSAYDKLYLNTNDNWLSVADYYANPNHAYKVYVPTSAENKIAPVTLGFDKTSTHIYLPQAYLDFLTKKSIKKLDISNWNLPIVGITKGKKLSQKQPYATLLMLSAYTGQSDLLKMMLKTTANSALNINLQQTSTGRTALYFVVTGNGSVADKINMLTLLLDKGANPYLTDFEGKNLFHYCADLNDAEIFEALLTHPKIDLKQAITLVEYPKEECRTQLAKNLDLSGYLLAKKQYALFKILLTQGDAKKIWQNLSGIVPSENVSQLKYVCNLLTIKEKEDLKNYITKHKLLAGPESRQRNTLKILESCTKQKIEKKISASPKKKATPPVKTKKQKVKKQEVKKPKKNPPVLMLFDQIKTRSRNEDGSSKRKVKPSEKIKDAMSLTH